MRSRKTTGGRVLGDDPLDVAIRLPLDPGEERELLVLFAEHGLDQIHGTQIEIAGVEKGQHVGVLADAARRLDAPAGRGVE